MPFAEPYGSCYRKVFAPALREAGYVVSRADDLFAPRPIMQDISAAILKADLILCEMSGKNPNVFYELGMAHAVGKAVILVSQNKEDIPFDLQHIRVLLYDYRNSQWGPELRKSIVAAAREIQASRALPWPPPLLPTDSGSPHRNISVLRGRPAVVSVLPEIVKRARKGDCLFGSCNLCSDYPAGFYAELPRAIRRGVRIVVVAQDRPDSEPFFARMRALRAISPRRVRVLRSRSVYLRLFALEGKEAILAIPMDDEFIGLHFRETRIAAFLKLAFDEIVGKSTEVH